MKTFKGRSPHFATITQTSNFLAAWMALCSDGPLCPHPDQVNGWPARIFEITRIGSVLALRTADSGKEKSALYPLLPQGRGIWLGSLLLGFSVLLLITLFIPVVRETALPFVLVAAVTAFLCGIAFLVPQLVADHGCGEPPMRPGGQNSIQPSVPPPYPLLPQERGIWLCSLFLGFSLLLLITLFIPVVRETALSFVLVAAVIAFLCGIAFLVPQLADWMTDYGCGEPLMLQGASIWPTILLRFSGIIVCFCLQSPSSRPQPHKSQDLKMGKRERRWRIEGGERN